MPDITINTAATADEIDACFPVMVQLRTHLVRQQFVEQVQRQQQQGYRLACLRESGVVRAVAGYRITESLYHGMFMYVDDLVTDESQRSMGFGAALFDWLVAQAREHGCKYLDLDSGVQRFAAHRFYLRKRMSILSHHFSIAL